MFGGIEGMVNAGIVFLVLLLLVMAAAAAGYIYIRGRIRSVSQEVFGTDSFIEGARAQEEAMRGTPKSIAGMTEIYLPKIARDFPEFSYAEIQRSSENILKAMLKALEDRSMPELSGVSAQMKNDLRIRLEAQEKQGIRQIFRDIRIHQTAITRYEKKPGSCNLTLQTSVEYRYARWKEEEEMPEPVRTQTRYNVEWIYIQDIDKLPESTMALAMNCPNCGAPITNLGSRHCEYCGTALEPLNIRVWSVNNIKEA